MADYDSSLPVRTRDADHLQSNITQVGGSTIAVDNPVFAELTDGTTALTATTIGADHCLDINLAGEGGAVISATNPVFAELTDGTNAIDASNPLNVQIGDGTTQVLVTAGLTALKVDIVGEGGAAIAVDNPVFAELTDGTTALTATTIGADHCLDINLAGEGGAAIAVDNPVFAELTDGTTALTATTIGADHCLDINLAGEGGTAISATNPVFAELTDGTNAIDASNPLNVQIGDGTTQVAVTAGLTALKVDIVGEGGAAIAVDNPVFAELTDGTTALTATTIGADHCLDINLVGEGGTAISATNPVFVEISDGTNAIGVDAGHPIYVTQGAPTNTFIEYTTGTVNTGATDSTTFNKEAASGSIYVKRIITSASGAHKAEVVYTETGADSTKAVGFATSAYPVCLIEFDNYEACACAQANDGIHVHITNREPANMDCYCSIIGHT